MENYVENPQDSKIDGKAHLPVIGGEGGQQSKATFQLVKIPEIMKLTKCTGDLDQPTT